MLFAPFAVWKNRRRSDMIALLKTRVITEELVIIMILAATLMVATQATRITAVIYVGHVIGGAVIAVCLISTIVVIPSLIAAWIEVRRELKQ